MAGSGADMLDRTAGLSRRPDLILCDYRLRDGENGIGAIKRLQSQYTERVPAVLITGDTAPDRLREARESGLILLHKPVAEIKLRRQSGTSCAPASRDSAVNDRLSLRDTHLSRL